jgi:hypothetical protein
MTRFYRLLAGLLLLAPASFAQQFYTSGYAVTTAGDTLRGDIRVKTNALIEFRHPETKLEKEFSTADVRAFSTGQHQYVAATWQEDSGETGRAFVRLRLNGYVKLYLLPQEMKEFSYVMQLPDQTFVPLRGKMAWTKVATLLTECEDPQFVKSLEATLFYYNLNYFERIIGNYNACVRPDLTAKVARNSFHFDGGIVAGASRNHWDYYFPGRNLIPALPVNRLTPAAIRPMLGVFVTLMPQKRLSLTVEAHFTSYQGQLEEVYSSTLNPRIVDRYFFEESYVSVPITGQYVWLNRKVRGYLKGGVAYIRPTRLDVKRNVSGVLNPRDTYSLLQLRPGTGFGFIGGTGVDTRLGSNHRGFAELRVHRHSVVEGVNRIAFSYSVQAVVGVSVFGK